MTNVFFTTNDDIIIGDPEGEYYPLVHALGGQVIHISPNSKDYINPMDINMNYSEDDNPLGVKSDFILSLCELIMGSRDGIEAEEKSVIDRCLPLVYQNYFSDPKPENMPILGDLYDCLRKQKEPQAQRIATALEIYVNGSLKVFNHQTNVELNNRIVCFDIKELGKQLKKLGMLIIQDQVWNRVTVNRGVKSTWYYIDEFHLLLKEEQTASYSVEIFKRFRNDGNHGEERIYDGFISMVNKLRFSEDNILGQVISRLEMTLAAMKRNNTAARDLSKSIAELNAKLRMLEQLRSKGYLAPEVYQAQANEINAELAKLKDVRQEKFNSKAATMLEEVRKLKMLIFEQEEPLEAFDEKLFLEIVKSIQINKEDEMSVELLGGLRFRERI